MSFQPADYRALCAEVDKEFMRGTLGAEQEQISNWMEVANIKTTGAGKVQYAQGNNAPKILPKGVTGYDFAEMALNLYSITSRRWGRGLKISTDDLDDDLFGTFREIINDLGASSVKLPQTLIWSWLKEGDQTTGPSGTLFANRDMTCIDGLAFFSASHKVNLQDSSLGTQSNLLTGTALTAANVETARAAMMNMKNTEGEPIGRQPTHIYVPPQLYKTAADIFYAPTITTAGFNTQANAASGVMERPPIKIAQVPELSGDATKWYLACKSDIGSPLIWQVTKPFELIPKIDPTSNNQFYDDMAEWLAKGRAEVGFGDYRRIIRCEA